MVNEEKKKHGAFFTGADIAKYLVGRVLKTTDLTILEPSFGDGVFMDAVINRFAELGHRENAKAQLYGVEIREEAIRPYRENPDVEPRNLLHTNFLDADGLWVDLVIGNPPYVSLNNLSASGLKVASKVLDEWGFTVPLNGSLWVPFVLHSLGVLKPQGCMALVLPFEMAYVRYSRQLWRLLGAKFSRLRLVRVYEDIFPDVDVETILFVGEGYGGSTSGVDYEVYQDKVSLFNEQPERRARIQISDILEGRRPFASALLDEEQIAVILDLKSRLSMQAISGNCKFKIGYVSADKKYFHPAASDIDRFGLVRRDLTPAVASAKELKKGLGLYIDRKGIKTRLFLPHGDDLDKGAKKYVDHGVRQGVNLGYKTRNREPWYLTPGVEIADVVLTVFGDRAGLYVNRGKVAASNSMLCGFIRNGANAEMIAAGWYNSLTQLSIELKVHSLGGGVLVFIPGEADAIEIIDPKLSEAVVSEFLPKLDAVLRDNDLDGAYSLGDELVLKKLGVTIAELDAIRGAIQTLRRWRNSKLRKV